MLRRNFAPGALLLALMIAALSSLDQAVIVVVANREFLCECKWLGTSYMVTRLWDIISDEWTDRMVIDEFNRGFSPIVTNLPGFLVYTSAVTGNASTAFFMNIFESEETAHAAQEGAATFVKEGALNGAITPNQFTETHLSFHITADNCVQDSIAGKYLSTRLWKLTPDSNFTIDGVSLEFEAHYKPIIQQEPGFLEYGGATVTGTDYIFFFNVFDTPEGAAAANAGATTFMKEGKLMGNIEKVVFTAGTIGFDYSCAMPVQQATSAAAAPRLRAWIQRGSLLVALAATYVL